MAVKVNKSPLMSSQLKAACQDVNQSYTTLKPAQKTRWNSTARNGESVLKLKEALIHLYEQNREKDERWGEGYAGDMRERGDTEEI